MAPAQYLQFLINSFTSVRVKTLQNYYFQVKYVNGHVHSERKDSQQTAVVRQGLGTEFRSEKIPRNRLGTVSVIPRKKVLIPRHSGFRGRANSEARNGIGRDGIREKMKFYGTV